MSLKFEITDKDIRELIKAVRKQLLTTPKEKYIELGSRKVMTYRQVAKKMLNDKDFAMMIVKQFNLLAIDIAKRKPAT